ncbi:MAG: hypothetical protein ABSB69_05570 [Solirubrobacteraceae bacterium]
MTTDDPVQNVPSGAFAESPSAASPDATSTFIIALYNNGILQGYLGIDDGGWAVLVSDLSSAARLIWYPYNSVNYIQVTSGNWQNYYMSVGTAPTRNGYVGFYGWWGAAGWSFDGTHLKSAVNQQHMSIYSIDNAYIYAWDAYTVLDVKLQST